MNIDPRFPTFEVDNIKFAMTYQEDDFGVSVAVLMFNGQDWIGWGGDLDGDYDSDGSLVAENVTDDMIMDKGTLHAFLEYCNTEAMARAKLKAKLPLPDPNNRIARLMYAMKALNKYDPVTGTLKYPPPPLP